MAGSGTCHFIYSLLLPNKNRLPYNRQTVLFISSFCSLIAETFFIEIEDR